MHPLALAESGWVWVGAGSRPAGLRTGRAIPGLRRDAALPVRQKTRQGREGGALPKPLSQRLFWPFGHTYHYGPARLALGCERTATLWRPAYAKPMASAPGAKPIGWPTAHSISILVLAILERLLAAFHGRRDHLT